MAELAQTRDGNPHTAYEDEDWHIGKVGLVYAGLFVFLVITPFILMAAYPSSLSDASRRLLVRPPAPELQVTPQHDLANFLLQQDQRLNTYYWVDKQKGVVHIPIREAMKNLARSGIGGFPKGGP
jgi:hypothetical protein